MAKITIGFSESKKSFPIICWLIMACEGTNFSHTYVKFKSESLDRDLIYHAVGSGLNFMGTAQFSAEHLPIEEYEIIISEEDKKKLLQFCVDNSGKPYGKMQIVGIGIKRLANLFGLKIKNPFANGCYAYVCTEFVGTALELTGKKMPDKDLDNLGLKEIREYVRSIASADLLPKQPGQS